MGRGITLLFMTAALGGSEWPAARPDRTLPPGKTWYPFYRRLGGPQGQSGQVENRVPTGIQSQTFQPIVSRYTNWATQPTLSEILYANNELTCYMFRPTRGHLQADIWNILGSIQMCGREILFLTGFCYKSGFYIKNALTISIDDDNHKIKIELKLN